MKIAAAAQLGTYADIMRLPLEVVYAAEELPEAIGKHSDADVVIVDFTGKHPNVYYEVKYATPEGFIFDVTESGWKGAVKDVKPACERPGV